MTITRNGKRLNVEDLPYSLVDEIFDAMDEGEDWGTIWYCGERYKWRRF